MDRHRFAIVGAGGIFTAEDAYAKIRLGSSLVQLLTALVYEGPGVVRRVTLGLARLLQRDGFAHVAEAVGVDAGAWGGQSEACPRVHRCSSERDAWARRWRTFAHPTSHH
jgi:hypothetical protein